MKYYLIALTLITGILTACGGSKRIAATEQTKQTVTVKENVVKEEVKTETKTVIEREAPEVEKDMMEAPKKEETLIVPNTDIQPNEEKMGEAEVPVKNILEAFDHTSYDDLISKYVSEQGNVDYDGFKRNWSSLRNYIKALSENMPTDAWSKEDKLAFWMNAYNAMTIDLILRNYPLASIKDIKDPWGQRFWKLGEKYYNLNEIEHKILRKMGDARIHFGINCASFSCPPLLNEAFTAQKVDKQLDILARRFVNDEKRNTITANSIEISEIFNWFAKDFKTDGSVIDFLNKYSDTPINAKAKRKYKDYNWSLNK
ncbi:DUF547 domain-containing protein [Dokdonia pacifica]|uniref:DUF547 domain-containing protein n=1 Tax=Dokdonia pacifica TaxID=1627892 RepID=A0A239AI74_9FLAO|nr:DUF547 domain-containing protein [Dokdonia pacifica]GGG37570.1 DUF547 domain-containing protein [Dokdonia pacifica]SNR94718.1 Protein of unknown function, DUF547 [Dokdonia pacifica]